MVYPRDTVILFQIGRGPWAPSLSPFPLKLETYLRMAKIPYQNVHGRKFSSKGKTPFIQYNGTEYADSSFIVDFLTKERRVDLNSHLSEEEKAISRAFQKMTEENLYWTIALDRWVYKDTETTKRLMKVPGFLVWYVRRMVQKSSKGHGMGRHSQEEVMEVMRADMTALSKFLGDKRFFMGDEPSEVDCAIFGMIAQIMWHCAGSAHEKFLKEELPNLATYCETMRGAFWSDWDECITHGHTKKATG